MIELLSELMMNLSTGMLLVAAATLATLMLADQRKLRWFVVLGAIVLSFFVPVADSNIWLWVNGAVGQLSILSLVLLGGFICRHLFEKDVLVESARFQMNLLILVAGLLLYPASLGLSVIDPYVLGFSFVLPVSLLLLAAIYRYYRCFQIAVILLLVVAAAEIPLSGSLNTWDYFIDPLVWLLSPISLTILLLRRKKHI